VAEGGPELPKLPGEDYFAQEAVWRHAAVIDFLLFIFEASSLGVAERWMTWDMLGYFPFPKHDNNSQKKRATCHLSDRS
jgi:hypothetical protein